MTLTRAYKVFTHAYRSPIQGGDPIWDGALPFTLPKVAVDESYLECAAGWNACVDEVTAVQISGIWRNGWPARLYAVETCEQVFKRGDKLRAATWDVVEERPIAPVIQRLSKAFGPHEQAMYAALMGWVHGAPDKYDVGMLQAYSHGLRTVAPIGPNEMGWVMV